MRELMCASCRATFPADSGQIHLQYGGVGRWFVCIPCCEEFHRRREMKAGMYEEPAPQFEPEHRDEESLTLEFDPFEDSDE